MSEKQDYIKCNFCDWKTPRWTTTKKGKRSNGGPRLLNHVESAHPIDYERIRKVVDAYKQMEEDYPI